MTIYNNFINWTKKKSEQFKTILAEPNPSQKAASGLTKTFTNLWYTLKAAGNFLQSVFSTAKNFAQIPYHAGLASHSVYTALDAEQDKEANLAWDVAKLEGYEIQKAGHQAWEHGTAAFGFGYETLSQLTESGLTALETTVHTGHAVFNAAKTTAHAVAGTPELIARAAQVVSDLSGRMNQTFVEKVASVSSYLPAFNLSTTNDTLKTVQQTKLGPSFSETEMVNHAGLST